MLLTASSPDIERVSAAMHAADGALLVDLMSASQAETGKAWVAGLVERAAGPQDRKTIVDGANVASGYDTFILKAAQSTVPLSGGLVPGDNWPAIEFGARTRRIKKGDSSRLGHVYVRSGWINRGLPSRQKFGRVAFKTASETVTALVGVWVKTIAEKYKEALGQSL